MDIEEARPWIEVAARDLRAVRNCLFGPEPTTEAAADHYQQAAEKLTKVALVSLGINVPFSHDEDAMAEDFKLGQDTEAEMKAEIARGLADAAHQRVIDFDIEQIIKQGRKLLAVCAVPSDRRGRS